MPEEPVRLAALAIAHVSFALLYVGCIALMAVCVTVVRNELSPRRRSAPARQG
jgi:hypothetical protein